MLQVLVKDETGRELNLQKDIKTRWNSLLTMIRNFLRIQVSIQKDLIDHGKLSMFPTDEEITYITELSEALQVMAYCSTQLGARDMNLARADQHYEFALNELDSLKSSISKRLHDNLYSRIVERRPKIYATLLAYLENRKFLDTRRNNLTYSTKARIQAAAEELYVRLFVSQEDDMSCQQVNLKIPLDEA